MRRTTGYLLVCMVAAAAVGLPSSAQGLIWSTVTVDPVGNVGFYTSLAVQANGDLAVSYYDQSNQDLKFTVCDLSDSAYGNCIQAGDWSTVTADSAGSVGRYSSLAVNVNADPMVSYFDQSNQDLKFAICDLSASANGSCDQTSDWGTVTVDSAGMVGEYTAIAMDANGNPMISYHDTSNTNLKFAVCDLSTSANGNCDQTSDWSTATVDSQGSVGRHTSIAVGGEGDALISYHSNSGGDLKLAVCDPLASANSNCNQAADWSTVTVDSDGSVGVYSSIAIEFGGDPMVSHYDATNQDLKFAVCDLSASANGNCNEAADWSNVTLDSDGGSVGMYSSIAIDADGDPMVSYYDATTQDLKFATCVLSASENGNCDQATDWSSGTVDSAGRVGRLSSVAANADGDPIVTYPDDTNGDLKFATTSLGDADGDGYPDEGDGCPTIPTPWPTPFDDADCDGFTDAAEAHVGTDAALACGPGCWPPDLGDTQTVAIVDVLALKPVFNTSVPPTSPRYDLAPSGKIDIVDVLALKPFFGQSCTS